MKYIQREKIPSAFQVLQKIIFNTVIQISFLDAILNLINQNLQAALAKTGCIKLRLLVFCYNTQMSKVDLLIFKYPKIITCTKVSSNKQHIRTHSIKLFMHSSVFSNCVFFNSIFFKQISTICWIMLLIKSSLFCLKKLSEKESIK